MTAAARDSLARRAARRAVRPLHRISGRGRIRARSRSIEAVARAPASPPAIPAQPGIRILSTHRVPDEQRLQILSTVTAYLGKQIGHSVPVTVSDASPEPIASLVRQSWLTSGTDVEISDVRGSLPASLDDLLRRTSERWFALQFDDMLTVGLTPGLLGAACRLLERHRDAVHVVCPFWPLEVLVEAERRRIRTESYEERERRGRTYYRFPSTRWLRPVAVEQVDGFSFGIFQNFTYGFFFNHLIAPVDDFQRRLDWYRRNVHPDDAHVIELAAAPKLRGPWWTHLAVPLDGCTLLDLDFAHTEAAVRAERPELREVHDAIEAGWPVVTGRRRAASALAIRR